MAPETRVASVQQERIVSERGRPWTGELQKHVFTTYVTLRYGLVFIGALLPIVLYAVGAAYGITLQGSMSGSGGRRRPARDCFVGGLFAVAACLYLYKGFSPSENRALNLAGIFGLARPAAEPGTRKVLDAATC